MRRFLESYGNRHAIGDLDELREAVDCVEVYWDLQPDRFNQRELNRQLRALTRDREVWLLSAGFKSLLGFRIDSPHAPEADLNAERLGPVSLGLARSRIDGQIPS